jgi:hypothetical protein
MGGSGERAHPSVAAMTLFLVIHWDGTVVIPGMAL